MRMFYTIAFVTLSCVACFGQSSYKGLTPGKSTRADVERVFSLPVKNVSKTLIEYKSPGAESKLYVQYRDGSPTGVVERIERTCFNTDKVHDKCGPALNIGQLQGVLADAYSLTPKPEEPGGFVLVRYYGAPRFTVFTHIGKGLDFVTRLAWYSKELYESAVPMGGCTGTIFGTWETDRGRMTIQRVGDNGVHGTYAKNNGTFSLWVVEGGYQGTWKDNTGTGEMALLHKKDTFSATWTGPGAKVPPKETPKPSVNKEREQIGAIIGAILGPTDTVKPSLAYGVLPPGEPWNGKCVP